MLHQTRLRVPGAGPVRPPEPAGSRAAVGRGPSAEFFLTRGLALEAGTLAFGRRGKGQREMMERGRPRPPPVLRNSKIDVSTGPSRRTRAPRGPHLTSPGSGPGAAAIWHPAAENAEQRCAAVPGPIAAGLVNFALLVCYIRYRLTPTVPPGDRPPRPPGGRSQCPSSAAAARSVRGEAAVTSEAAPRALGESLSSSDDETWFLVSFWKRAAERVRSACKPIGTRGRGAPVPAGQGTVGPGSAAALGRVPWAEAGEPL